MYPPLTNPLRVIHHNRGYGYGVAAVTGTMAAALAQDSLIFSIQCGAQASAQAADRLSLWFDRIRLAFTTIVAFTTPITAARRIGLYRATLGPPTGGTAMAVVKKDSNGDATVVTDARIATTAGLTANGTVREANPIALMDLVHVGAAGGRQDFLYELAAPFNAEQAINPGELLVASNPVAMDAAGTWQLSVDECHWCEAKRFEK